MILEDVRFDAAVYRQKIIGKDGVFQLMRQKTWWFHKTARYTTVRGTRVPCGTLSGDKCSGTLRHIPLHKMSTFAFWKLVRFFRAEPW